MLCPPRGERTGIDLSELRINQKCHIKKRMDQAGIEPASENLFIWLLPSQPVFYHSLRPAPVGRLRTSVASYDRFSPQSFGENVPRLKMMPFPKAREPSGQTAAFRRQRARTNYRLRLNLSPRFLTRSRSPRMASQTAKSPSKPVLARIYYSIPHRNAAGYQNVALFLSI